MVIACHFTFSAYGFWPPNDDRGSWSERVWAEHLKPFGEVKKVTTRRSIAHVPHDRQKNADIRASLLRPPVKFDANQREVIATAFGETIALMVLRVHALAVMADHVHVVASKHEQTFEEMIGRLKRSASTALGRAGLHPFAVETKDNSTPTPWAKGGWKRFCFDERDVASAVNYVLKNPERAGLPPQRYGRVVPFR